jgi:protein TonB
LRRYAIPLAVATAIHLGLAFWPEAAREKTAVRTAARTATALIEMSPVGENLPQSAESASSAEQSDPSEPMDEPAALLPPVLADHAFEIASLVRKELGDYAQAHAGKSQSFAVAEPALAPDGGAFALIGRPSPAGATAFAPEPPYPPAARQEGREGIVELEVTVRPSGRVQAAVVAHSSGHADLDRAARETVVTKWRLPVDHDGHSLTQYVRVAFKLTANERRK